MKGSGALLKKELKEQWRTYRVLIVAGVFLLLGLSTPLMLYYLPQLLEMTGEDIIVEIPEFNAAYIFGEYASTITQMGILVAVLIGMGTIAQERSRGTLAMTLSKPVSWGTFIAAKLIGMSIIFVASLAIAGLGCYGYTWYLFDGTDALDFTILNLLLALFFITCLAEIVLCSSFFKNQLAAGGLGLGVLIVQAGLSGIPQLSNYLPNALVNGGVRLVSGEPSNVWPSVGISAGIICTSMLISRWVLGHKEL